MNRRLHPNLLLSLLVFFCNGIAVAATPVARPLPVIDMHVHADSLSEFGNVRKVCSGDQPYIFPGLDPREPITIEKAMRCPTPLVAPTTDDVLMRDTLAMFKRYNVRHAITSGDRLAMWHAAAPDIIVPGMNFDSRKMSPAEFRLLYAQGKFKLFAEIGMQYEGRSPSDPVYEPYFALAEALDIPIGIHMGEGPPGGPNAAGYTKYRVRFGNPLLLEDVLARHPHLRIYVMHYGSPFVDEMIAMLYSYPQLYVDVAANDWNFPRKQFYGALRRLVDAGFGKRIMFGSDQMIWPQTIGIAIESIEQADFLTEEQKRDILYNNAARFLRLSKTEIARDYGR